MTSINEKLFLAIKIILSIAATLMIFSALFQPTPELRNELKNPINKISLSSDGRYAITSNKNGNIILWDISKRLEKQISSDGNEPYFIKNSHSFLWQDNDNNIVHVQDVNGKELKSFTNFLVKDQVMTADLNHYYSLNDMNDLYSDLGKEQKRIAHIGDLPTTTLNISDNQNELIINLDYPISAYYEVNSKDLNGTAIFNIASESFSFIAAPQYNSMIFSSDHKAIIVSVNSLIGGNSEKNYMAIWNSNNGIQRHIFDSPYDEYFQWHFSPYGPYFIHNNIKHFQLLQI